MLRKRFCIERHAHGRQEKQEDNLDFIKHNPRLEQLEMLLINMKAMRKLKKHIEKRVAL